MPYRLIFLGVHLAAILLPFFGSRYTFDGSGTTPPFPDTWEGRALTPCPLHMEDAFFKNFPGTMARFTDGQREYIMRWVTRPTRQLHSSVVCFEASGYRISPLPVQQDPRGRQWTCFEAEKNNQVFRVYTGIEDPAGNSWYDSSSWYWDASMGKTQGPWLSVTHAEKMQVPEPQALPPDTAPL